MTSIKTGPSKLGMHLLAIPAAIAIIIFLGYSSQWLFSSATYLEPGPLTTTESVIFNVLLCCLWWTYFRACTVDPGRYVFDTPEDSGDSKAAELSARPGSSSSSASSSHAPTASLVRWCKKCDAPKPARSHHCRHCARCIPKMDHHCPWTGNCVSMQTFPHFLRFVVFTNASLWTLAVLLGRRFYSLYAQRHLPAYLGPTLPQLVHLTVLGLICGATLLALTIMLYTTVQNWIFNTTMIESWEIERHEAVVDRYSTSASDGTWWDEENDSDLDDDDDEDPTRNAERKARRAVALRMRVEFPYDLGFFENMAQAMGTRNVFLWFFPFAGGPKIAPSGTGPGWDWPENGFNDHRGMWPPPDPEKVRHAAARGSWVTLGGSSTFATGRDDGQGLPDDKEWSTPEAAKAAFQARQAADFRRRRIAAGGAAVQTGDGSRFDPELDEGMDGEPGWTNADGDRLRDYGVDEDAENDEDVPLAQLLERRATKPAAAEQKTDTKAKGKGKNKRKGKKA